MPPEKDSVILEALLMALEDPASNVRRWSRRADKESQEALPGNLTPTARRDLVRRELVRYLRAANVPNRIEGDEDALWEFRVTISNVGVYVKVALDRSDPDVPELFIVSFHEGWS